MSAIHYYNDVLGTIKFAREWTGGLEPKLARDFNRFLNDLRKQTLRRRRRLAACRRIKS